MFQRIEIEIFVALLWQSGTRTSWSVTSPVVVLPGAQVNLWSSRKIKPGWRLWCGASVPVKHSVLFASDKQSPRLLTKDAARTDIPVCFRSSTQAQSQGFPLSEGGKELQYHLLWSEGDVRLEGLFQTFPDLGFSWEVSVSVLSWPAEGWKPVRFWDGADSFPSSISSCLHSEALLHKHFLLCGHGCVFRKPWR